MTGRQNIFGPIHKGIRSMIFENAKRLQSMDFADLVESNRLVNDLQHDLSDSMSNCLLCLMSVHTKHEEGDIFAKLRVHDTDAVDLVMKEHVQLAKRIREVSEVCESISRLSDPAERVKMGERLGLEATELFSYYLVHLGHEDDWVVPVMWQWFSDEQLNSMRAVFYNNLPLPLYETWMQWTLPALNPSELRNFFDGAAGDPAPNRLNELLRIAKKVLRPERWQALERLYGHAPGGAVLMDSKAG